MTQIQIHLSEDENKIVEIYKAIYGLQTKQEAIKQIVRKYELPIK